MNAKHPLSNLAKQTTHPAKRSACANKQDVNAKHSAKQPLSNLAKQTTHPAKRPAEQASNKQQATSKQLVNA